MMKHIIILIMSMVVIQGCSVYGGLTKCDGFDEAGTRCTNLLSNLEYSKQLERGVSPELEETKDKKKSKLPRSAPDGIICADGTVSCVVQINYKLLDAQVKNDEFARLILNKKIGMAETDPVLRPAKTVKATIYPYSDGTKFYQLRHIWIKTHEESWVVGNSTLVDDKGTVIMDKAANVNTIGADNAGSININGDYSDRKTQDSSISTRDSSDTNIKTGIGSHDKASLHGTDRKTATGDIIQIEQFYTESAKDIDSLPRGTCILDANCGKGPHSFKTGDIATINVVYLNVRQEPNEKSTIIGVIPAGGKLRILDETDGKWQRVKVVYYPKNKLQKEYAGWVHSGYLMPINTTVETWEDAL